MPRPRSVIIGRSLTNYARVDSLAAALHNITEVTTLSTPPPDKPYRFSFVVHMLRAIGRVFTIHIPSETAIVVILFPDNENVWTASMYRLLHRRRYKIVFDPFISIYDTYVYNKPLRALSYPLLGSLLAWWLRWYEARLFHRADILLTDTDNHGRYLTRTLGITKPFQKILLTTDEKSFMPSRMEDINFWHREPLQVLWYGKVSLMHGVDYIWQALQGLPTARVVVTLIGNFSEFEGDMLNTLVREGKLIYVAEKPPHYAGQKKIIECITQSHVVLGMFGRTDKSANVITNKEYEALASGRCLVTLQGEREFLRHDYNCLMVNQHNPQDLAKMLTLLNKDRALVQRIARQGREDYVKYASQERLVESLRKILLTTSY